MKDITLKPCPFCQEFSENFLNVFYNKYYDEFSCNIYCEQCGAAGPTICKTVKLNELETGEFDYDNKIVNYAIREAKIKWNKRKKKTNDRYNGNKDFVIERDGFRCSMCGKVGSIVVHHIDGYFEDKPENNCEEKLITLCYSCHYKVHHYMVDIPEKELERIGYFE